MNEDTEPDIEMIASIDTIGAIAYARGMGEGVAAFYKAMVDNGLPAHLAETAVIGYLVDKFGTTLTSETDEDEEDEDE